VGLNARLKDGRRYSDGVIQEHLTKSKLAAALLGVNQVIHFDFPDNRFDSIPMLDIIQEIEEVINKFRPDTIFTHSNKDLNIDHRIAFQSVLTATRPFKNHAKEIYSFEIPSSTEWAFGRINGNFNPNCFFDIEHHVDQKIEALKIYDSEIHQFPHPRSEEAIRSNAKKWGYASGLMCAEAFEVIRIIR
jgi:LmbE family N-acetylglucosaminyl deacetylase